MSFLVLDSLEKSYVPNVHVLKQIRTTIQKGGIHALVGESGCGKTTLLRSIAGFEQPESGSITLDGVVLQDDAHFVAPEKRNIGFLFQDYALFPHLTIEANIAFGLGHLSKTECKKRVNEVMQLLGIQELGTRYPHQISGGQQQRVALARALAPSPSLLLMDEPFSNIDNLIKDQVRSDLKQLLKAAGITTILVTHDMQDAMVMADKIMIMKEGEILQNDTPQQLYHAPVNSYVAGFFGKTNWLDVVKKDQVFSTVLGEISIHKEGKLLVRPEDIVETENGVKVEVVALHYRGDSYEMYVKLNDQMLILNTSEKKEVGSTLTIRMREKSEYQVFP